MLTLVADRGQRLRLLAGEARLGMWLVPKATQDFLFLLHPVKLTYWETNKALAETHASLPRDREGGVIAQRREELGREGTCAHRPGYTHSKYASPHVCSPGSR